MPIYCQGKVIVLSTKLGENLIYVQRSKKLASKKKEMYYNYTKK